MSNEKNSYYDKHFISLLKVCSKLANPTHNNKFPYKIDFIPFGLDVTYWSWDTVSHHEHTLMRLNFRLSAADEPRLGWKRARQMPG